MFPMTYMHIATGSYGDIERHADTGRYRVVWHAPPASGAPWTYIGGTRGARAALELAEEVADTPPPW